MSTPIVGFAGMTHLGLTSGAAAAEKGFTTVCFDPDASRIGDLDAGRVPVIEPRLAEILATNRERLAFTARVDDLARCDVLYVSGDVPTDDVGHSDLLAVESLVELAVRGMRRDAVVVILSQVPPGFTRLRARPDLRLYYQVETLVFGQAVDRALKPERIVVGCARTDEPLPRPYDQYLASYGCPILRMGYESAELSKIAINMCLLASLSVANTLAELCEHTGAIWSEIVPALRTDRRIGPHAYLTPGLGIGGGNLERDLATVCGLAEALGTDSRVVRAWSANSRYRRDWALRTLHRTVLAANPEAVVAILGLAYKEGTRSTKNSPSLSLIRALGAFRVKVFDPVVPASEVPPPGVVGAGSPLEACDGADAVVLMTPWPEFRLLAPAAIREHLRGRVVLDPHGLLDAQACAEHRLDTYRLGAPPPRSS